MKIKNVKIPIYGGQLIIIRADNWDEVEFKFKKSFHGCLGAFFQVGEIRGKYYVAFEGIPTCRTIVHESIHVCSRVFEVAGIEKDVHNDEPEAYFVDWIFNEIEKFFYE